ATMSSTSRKLSVASAAPARSILLLVSANELPPAANDLAEPRALARRLQRFVRRLLLERHANAEQKRFQLLFGRNVASADHLQYHLPQQLKGLQQAVWVFLRLPVCGR